MKMALKKLAASVLAIVMVLSMIPAVPIQAASATYEDGTINSKDTIAPVYNQAIYEHLKLNKWLTPGGYVGIHEASGSIGPLFRSDVYQGHQQALGYNGGSGYNLVTETTLKRDSVWTMAEPGWFSAVKNNPDVKMRLGGSLINGAGMSILSGNVVVGTHQGQGGKTVTATADVPLGDVLKTTGNIDSPYIVLMDNAAPTITNVSGDESYIEIRFDEPLRWANGSSVNSLDEYTITVKISNATSGLELGELTYQASSVSGDTIRFIRISDAPAAGNYRINSISTASNGVKDEVFEVYGIKQCYRYSIGTNTEQGTADYGKHIYKEPYVNNAIKKIDEVEDMAPLTDLAGNAVELTGDLDLRGYQITFDTQAPTLEEIYLTGDMIDDTCEIPKEDWPDDADFSSLYAGKGDQLYFHLRFSEGIVQRSDHTITLNVNEKGSPVVLRDPTYTLTTTANDESYTVVCFGPFAVTEEMSMASGYKDAPIAVIGLGGADYYDYAYNDWDGTIPPCAQGIYLDADAPAVVAKLVGGYDAEGKVNREPTIRLIIEDGTGSGSLGLKGKVGLSATTEAVVEYEMAISDFMTAPADAEYIYTGKLGGGQVSWQELPLYSNNRCLHIRLLGENGTITLEELKVQYQIPDWAGNVNASDAALVEPKYAIDETAPTVTAPQFTVSYGATSATIVSATWSGADFNQADGLTAYYQWSDSDSKPEDYSSGWEEAGKLTDGFRWELAVGDEFHDTVTRTLWVYVKDASGNVSAMASNACTLKLEKASTNFVLETDPQIPTADPDLWVTAGGSETAWTYATLTLGTNLYVTKISSAEGAVDLFPIQREVVDASGNTLSATEFNAILNAYYGEVTVSFESAFQNVALSAGGDLKALINDGSYSDKEGSVPFRYAPKVADVHTLSVSGKGELATTESALLFYQTIRGLSVEVTIQNALQPDWGLSDVDFDKSLLTLACDGKTVYQTNLAASGTQTLTLPDLNYETGAYTVTVTVTSRGGSVTTAQLGTVLVVDNTRPTNVGVWDAYITPGLSLGYLPSLIQSDEDGNPILSYGTTKPCYLSESTTYVMEKTGDRENGKPIEALTLNMSGQRESVRSDTYTVEVSGIQNFGFTVSVDDTSGKISGLPVGGVAALYVWNPEIHTQRSDGFVTTEGTSWSYASGDALDHDTWSPDERSAVIKSSTLNLTEDGCYAMAKAIGLKPGTTTLCYQVIMDNGLESPVYRLQLHTTTETPTAGLNMQVTAVKDTPDVENDIIKADVSLQNVFAVNGLHTTAWLAKADAVIDGVEYPAMSRSELLSLIQSGYYGDQYTDISMAGNAAPTTDNVLSNPAFAYYRFLPIATDAAGIVTLIDRGYETYSTQVMEDYLWGDTVTYKRDEYSAAGAFLLMDESGGTAMVFPQFTMEDASNATVPAIEGYAPRYTLADRALAFYRNPSITQNSSGEIAASVKNVEYMDSAKSTVTFVYEDGTKHSYPLAGSGAPNADGYLGASVDGGVNIFLSGPINDALAGTAYDKGVTVRLDLYDSNLDTVITECLQKYNNSTEATEPVNVTGLKYASSTPSVTTGWYSTGGVRLWWDNPVKLDGETGYSQQWLLPIFRNGTYSVSFTDAFGNYFEDVSFAVTGYDGPNVAVDNLDKTSQPVHVDVTIPAGAAYSQVYVTADTNTAVISGSGTAHVTVEVTEPSTLKIAWNDQSKKVSITNVCPAEPTVIWSYGESANDYTGGDVTAYVVDASGNWDLIDPLTGETPQYTFTAGSDVTEYTFPSVSTGELLEENVHVDLGSITAQLEVELTLPEEPSAEDDNRAPSVQLMPYAMQNGLAVSLPMALTLADDGAYDDLSAVNPALTPYHESKIKKYVDSAAFTEALGWASLFRFQIEVQDLSETRLLLKDGLYAEEPSSFDRAQSEEIANVKLSGHTLEVFGSAQFTLFVIDAADNCVAIPMDVYNVGAAPVPTYVKIPTTTTDTGDNAVEIRLTAPEGVSELTITGVNGAAATTAILTANGTHTVDYSCIYQGQTVTGQLKIVVSEIDNAPPLLQGTKWSANKVKATNQDVTVTLTFNKAISRVQSDSVPDTVKVLLSGNTATVRYTDNTKALKLYFQGANGKWTDAVLLDEIANIDRTAPEITVSEPVLSTNGKKAVITFTANERVSFREASRVGTTFTRTIKENGTYTFTFADVVGNVTTRTVTVDTLVTEPLTMQFSRNANGEGAVRSPDELGALLIGDTFYVSLNRAATVDFNREKTAYTSGWMALTMGDRSGGVIGARDAYGNTASAVFSHILYPDTTAPRIAITLYTIHVSGDITGAQLEERLLANAEAVDDRAGAVSVTVTLPDSMAAGDYPVVYTATDAAGNRASVTGMLTIHADAVPAVWVDGELVERERIYLAEGDDALLLKVDMQGQPYTVTYKKNIKTVAQMKRGATELELTDDAVALPFSGTSGYYTVCITTQDHDQYRIVIYVK